MPASRMIDIAKIDAGDRLRALDPAWVKLLAEEIETDGLQEPIHVVERGDGFKLIAGARRIAAMQLLGDIGIMATVLPAGAFADEAAIRLAEIKADMMRGDLTALDHAIYVATWCDLYREAQGPQKRGPKAKAPTTDAELEEFSAKLALNWTEAAQEALGIGRRTVFRSLKIAGIAADQRSRIALHPIAGKQTELLLLADQEKRQTAIVDMLVAEPATAASVTEAIALLDSVPPVAKKAVYERTYDKMSSWKPAEREQLFALFLEEIEEFMARRHGAGKAKAA